MIRLHFDDGSVLDVAGKTLVRVEYAPTGTSLASPTTLGHSTNRDGSLRKRAFRLPAPGTGKWRVLAAFEDGAERTAFDTGEPINIASSQCSRLAGAGLLVVVRNEPSGANGHATRKVYRITEKGGRVLADARAAAAR